MMKISQTNNQHAKSRTTWVATIQLKKNKSNRPRNPCPHQRLFHPSPRFSTSDEWNGQQGTIIIILKNLKLPKRSNSVIQKVLESYSHSIQMNAKYNGDQKPGSGWRPELEKDAFQIQLVIDGMQNGLAHLGTHLLVNEFRKQNGQEPVGKSAIAGMVKRLNPKVDDVTRRTGKHGSWVSMGHHKNKLGHIITHPFWKNQRQSNYSREWIFARLT